MKHLTLILAIFASILFSSFGNQKSITTALKVEMQENPQGIGTLQPRFSWKITSANPNLKQISYQIQVATSLNDLKKGENLL